MSPAGLQGARQGQRLQVAAARPARTNAPALVQTHEITFDNHQEIFGDFYCQCRAFNERAAKPENREVGILSPPVKIEKGEFSNDMLQPPTDQTGFVGGSATFICRPPRGKPVPEVRWKVNDQLLERTDSGLFRVSAAGELNVKHLHAGLNNSRVQCAASNAFGSVLSEAATLTVRMLVFCVHCSLYVHTCCVRTRSGRSRSGPSGARATRRPRASRSVHAAACCPSRAPISSAHAAPASPARISTAPSLTAAAQSGRCWCTRTLC